MEFVSIPAYVVVCFKLLFKNCKIFPVRKDVLFNRIDMSKKTFFFISWFIRVINLCVKVLGKSNALLKKIRRALNSRKVNALWKKNISIAKCTLFLIRMQLQFDLMFIFFINNGEHNLPSFIGTWNRQPNCPTVSVYHWN